MKTLNKIQSAIATRYENIHAKYNNCPADSRMTTMMDFSLIEDLFPNFKWEELLNADDFNFIHDVFGIKKHIDRKNMQFDNVFVPRFSGNS